jgi:hypothetical protein
MSTEFLGGVIVAFRADGSSQLGCGQDGHEGWKDSFHLFLFSACWLDRVGLPRECFHLERPALAIGSAHPFVGGFEVGHLHEFVVPQQFLVEIGGGGDKSSSADRVFHDVLCWLIEFSGNGVPLSMTPLYRPDPIIIALQELRMRHRLAPA